MTTTRQAGEAVIVPREPDKVWIKAQAESLSADKGPDAVGALAWNLLIYHRRTTDKCDPASDLEQVIQERDEAVRLLREALPTNEFEVNDRIRAFLSRLDNPNG
jgi:hypothetical protein